MARSIMALKIASIERCLQLIGAVRLHHTRSLSAESTVQTEQWCCCFCRPRSTFGLAKIVAIRTSSQRCRSTTTVCARTPRDVGTEPELRIPGAAAQTRMVSRAGIRFGSWESARSFKGIIFDDVSEFESHMPSHAVESLCAMFAKEGTCGSYM